MTPVLRRYAAALAFCAAFLGTFAPSITHLLQTPRGAQVLGEICSAANSRSTDTPQQPMSLHADCCQFCASHAFAHSPPPAEVLWRPALLTSAYSPVARSEVRLADRLWQPAQPRGPPVVS